MEDNHLRKTAKLTCKACRIEKDREEFYRLTANKTGRMGKCIECYRLTQKK